MDTQIASVNIGVHPDSSNYSNKLIYNSYEKKGSI